MSQKEILKEGKNAAEMKDGEPGKNKVEKEMFRRTRGLVIFATVFSLATIVSTVFHNIASDPSLNIAMIYVLGLFLVARYTDGYVFGLLFAVCSVVSVNYFFTYPYQDLNFTMDGYQVTFAGMLIIAMITSAMTTNMKDQATELAEQEKQLMEAQKEKMRANLLRAVSHDLRTPLTGIIGNSFFLSGHGRFSVGRR